MIAIPTLGSVKRCSSILLAFILASASACMETPGDDAAADHSVAQSAIAVGSPWVVRQVGGGTTIAPTDDVTPATGTHTVRAAGVSGDSLGFVHANWAGDGEVVARVTRVAGLSGARAGLMFRSSLDTNAAFMFAYLNGGGGVAFMRRAHIGVGTFGGLAPAPASSWLAPVWLKVARSGNVFRAFTSQNGLTWTFVGDASTSGFGSSALVGMAVVSSSATQAATAEFDSVDVGRLPSAWEPRLVGGGTGEAMRFDQTSTTFTARGWGGGIAGTADAFAGALRTVTGDGELVAKVTSPAGGTSAKIGIMLRGDASPSAPHTYLHVVPGGAGVKFTRRAGPGTSSAHTGAGSGTGPFWLKLTRRGSTVEAHASTDGSSWFFVTTSTLSSLGTTIQAGIAVTGGSSASPATAAVTGLVWRPSDARVSVDAFLDDRWSGATSLPLLEDLAAAGVGIDGLESLLRRGRASYPQPPQPRGRITTQLPVTAEHVDHQSQYIMYVPNSYDPARPTPLLVIGHGGSATRDLAFGESAAMLGLNPWVATAEKYGLLMVAPLTDRGWGAIGYSILFSTLSKVTREYNVDPDRIYISGHSMGGHLSYRSGIYLGDRWGAVGPMSGGYDYVANRLVDNLINTPGYSTWGEFEPFEINLFNRRIRDWMSPHRYDWVMREQPGGGHEIFPAEIEPAWLFFNVRSRSLYKPQIQARASGRLAYDAAETNPAWGKTHTWNAARPIPASTFAWVRLRPIAETATEQVFRASNVGGNRIDITAENVRSLRLFFHPRQIDFSRDVQVVVNGATVSNRPVVADMVTTLNLVREFDDRGRIFHGYLDLEVATNGAVPEPMGKSVEGPSCNGTTGSWAGCRGTGCIVCEDLIRAYPRYLANHPACTTSTTCAGQYYTCNASCPAPTEADR